MSCNFRTRLRVEDRTLTLSGLLLPETYNTIVIYSCLFQLGRMTKVNKEKIVDSDRRVHSSIYKDMGIVSSYAWKGYN